MRAALGVLRVLSCVLRAACVTLRVAACRVARPVACLTRAMRHACCGVEVMVARLLWC